MKVLIVDFDLFSIKGGGQRVYSKLIAKSPERQFYFFSRQAESLTSLAANATAIPFVERYRRADHRLAPQLSRIYDSYLAAYQYAAAARATLGPTHFDVVDVPDYTTDALFIRAALNSHGITVGVVALAMHGTISHAFRGDWNPDAVPQDGLRQLDVLEKLQYQLCDVRYAISETYAELWEQAVGAKCRLIDPLHIIGGFRSDECAYADPDHTRKPDLVLVGRRERRKGADLLLDLAWAVGSDNYGALRIIGGESVGITGTPSLPILRKGADLRRISIEITEPVSFDVLSTIFRARTIVVLPSRIDSFNLVALEALRLGCPVFVSRQTGVSRWIESNYPELSDLIIDLGCGREAAARIRRATQDYDAWRARIAAAISARPLQPVEDDLASMYIPFEPDNVHLKSRYAALAEIFATRNRPLPRHNALAPEAAIVPKLAEETPLSEKEILQIEHQAHLIAIANYSPSFKRMPHNAALGPDEMDAAIRLCNEAVGTHRSGRAEIFERLRRFELVRENSLTAALYDLRLMRWLGRDGSNRLDDMERVLSAQGFRRDAEVARAMYEDPQLAHDRCAALIDEQYRRCLVRQETPLQIHDDRRTEREPKVSIIVSMYNAADKLPTLLENISIQTLARDGLVEVILVDSGSPGQEHSVFLEKAPIYGLPIVFARSRERETIQAAWNRGIGLARAPYLCFYGVDEGMHPDCLARLSSVLDSRPDVDWVMADSLVTEVDRDGVFSRDVMEYRRDDLDREMVYLDTCYLSWVGGLYRRSIHERFGYYDETFRAAGDTEFKCRLLGRINILHIPEMLGVFNNYPEERTTAHPRAEIEDQRAWYLHRTTAGMANLFDGREIGNAERLFRSCLGYRKSYCNHVSTDFDLAASVVGYMERRGDNPAFTASARVLVERLLSQMLEVDHQKLSTPVVQRQQSLSNAFSTLREAEIDCGSTFGLSDRPRFRLFNDNRHEQHWWSWSAV